MKAFNVDLSALKTWAFFMDLNMKLKFLFCTVYVLAFSGCDVDSRQVISGKPVLTQKETVTELNELARQLATDRSWVDANSIAILHKTALKLNSGTHIGSLYRLDDDGVTREYLITLETNGKNGIFTLGKVLDGNPYRIALDPDQFYLPKDPDEELWTSRPVLEIPSFLYIAGSEPVYETILHGPGVTPEEPIFFITLRENYVSPSEKRAIIAGTYITYRGLDLRYDTDNNNEEFEAYLAIGSDPMNSPFLSSTTHMFDGEGKQDAAGESKTYPDIDYIESGNEWDVDSIDAICLRLLDGNIFRLTAIEDDQIVGKFVRPSAANSLNKFKIDYYDMADGRVTLNIESNFTVHQYNSDADDRLPSAGVTGINEYNLSQRIGNRPFMQTDEYTGQYHLTSLNWKLGKKVIN